MAFVQNLLAGESLVDTVNALDAIQAQRAAALPHFQDAAAVIKWPGYKTGLRRRGDLTF